MNDNDIIQLALEHFGASFKPSDLEVKLAALVAAEKEKQIINILERLQQHRDFHNYYTYAINVIRQEYPR